MTELHNLGMTFGAHGITYYSAWNSYSTTSSCTPVSKVLPNGHVTSPSHHSRFALEERQSLPDDGSVQGGQIAVEPRFLVPGPRTVSAAVGVPGVCLTPRPVLPAAPSVKWKTEAWLGQEECWAHVQNWIIDSFELANGSFSRPFHRYHNIAELYSSY